MDYLGVKILLQICYDLRFPVFSRSNGDYDLALYVANWPAARSYVWKSLLVARAIENQCYIVAANQCGSHDGNRETWGHSVIIAPWGDVLAQQGTQPGVIAATLDPQQTEHIRKSMPVQLHARLTPAWRE